MQYCKELIKNRKYRNWVKCTIGIQQTSKALHEYVYVKFSLYLQGIAGVTNAQDYLTDDERSHFRDELTSLFRQNLKGLYRFKNDKWHFIKNCPDCKETFYKILSLHKYQKEGSPVDYKDIHWANSNDTRELTPEWALAKIFMSKGNESNTGPSDTDPYALFVLMKMCKLFMNAIKVGPLDEVINARNALFHSCENLVDDRKVEKYFESMKLLLSNASNDRDIGEQLKQKISEDIENIKKLCESEMTMTLFEDAQEAIRIKRTAIYYDFERCLCDNDPKQLEELFKLSGKLECELVFLNNNAFLQNNISNLQVAALEKAFDEQTVKQNN